jgi:hypothetical protein
MTLELVRDHEPFAAVGERCGHRLCALAARVSAAREDPEQAEAWPDPDDRFPEPGQVGQPGQGGQPGQPDRAPGQHPQRSREHYLPGEREFFSLRSREPGDLPGTGELRCTLRTSAEWLAGRSGARRARTAPYAAAPYAAAPYAAAPDADFPHGGWRLTRRAVLEAWGTAGIGVRAVLTSAELVTFLDTVLKEPEGAGVVGSAPVGATISEKPGGISRPSWPQQGRVPDGTAQSRLPALRAQA